MAKYMYDVLHCRPYLTLGFWSCWVYYHFYFVQLGQSSSGSEL